MRRSTFYISLLTAGAALELLFLRMGERLQAAAPAGVPWHLTVNAAGHAPSAAVNHLAMTLVQIIVIVVCGQAVALLLRGLRQPAVVGQIAAGILLGPSALGALAPDFFLRLFPPESIPTLLSLSQIGLIFFMFLVGLEFTPELMRERRESIVVISHVSILVPFVMGTALALYLYPRVSDSSVTFRSFALFLGTSMSITAFPVLARILAERHLQRTRMGNTVIACAAVDDVTAWCVLAFVVMVARAGNPTDLLLRIGMLAVFICLMIVAVRPLLVKLVPALARKSSAETVLAAVLLLVLASACTTELLGIHALFGAFLVGAIMPREGSLTATLVTHTKGLTTVIFLPLFFAVTGLRTNVGLLQQSSLWLCCASIVLVAIVGKIGGALFSAASVGFSWREASGIGVLMNTRGLMEMVVLNIGMEIGVVSRPLFTMIVLMALVTTAMTTPLLDWLVPGAREVAAPEKWEAVA
jgi:Kef-type K+ transport system membrane component KefB